MHVHHLLLWGLLSGFVSGTGLTRALIYLSKKLPPLPKNAGFWAQFLYNVVSGASGLDPNASIISPGAVSKIMGAHDAPEAT